MNDLVLILITFFCITSAKEWECPAVETLKNCLCYPKSRTIHCINITDLPILSEPLEYNLINFKNISLQRISKANLGSATFKKIVIEDNLSLTTLDDDIFLDSPEVLVIRNNPVLTKESLYAALKNMKRTEIVDIEKNSKITEVGNGAFNNSLKLKQIFLQNNGIEKILGEPFIGLKDLKEIRLDNNNITQLQKSCFDVNSTIIEINLNNNKMLTADKLEGITWKNTTIINLRLENTSLNVFPKKIFLPFFANNESMVHLSGNLFQCSCDDNMIWVLDRNYASLSRQIIHLKCIDYNKDIFRLTRKDICGEETTTSTTIEPLTPTEQSIRTEVPQTTSEPSEPTEHNTRKEEGIVEPKEEPTHPPEKPIRKEPELDHPNENPIRKEPELDHPNEKPTREMTLTNK